MAVTDSATAVAMAMAIESLVSPTVLLSRDEALNRTTALPKAPGVYAWYFDELPPGVPIGGCIVRVADFYSTQGSRRKSHAPRTGSRVTARYVHVFGATTAGTRRSPRYDLPWVPFFTMSSTCNFN